MPRPRKRIPKSSVFAEFRKLPKVGQLFAPVDDWPEEKFASHAQLVEAIPDHHVLQKYFGYAQHDATVMDLKRGKEDLVLMLCHHDITNLACTLMHWDWNEAQTYFPVELRFQGVREFHVLRCVEQGTWQLIRSSKRNLFKCLRDIQYFEMLHFEEGQCNLRLSIHGKKPFVRGPESTKSWYMNEYSFLVNCESVEIVENLRENWVSRCGKNSLKLFDSFYASCPMCCLGYPDLGGWIVEFEQNHAKK